jgi:galactokinase
VQCGIMDQFASMFGKHNHVIRLDCRSLEYEYVPFNIEGYKIVLLDTGVKHSLASSEYNVRRAQCEKGVAIIQQKFDNVKSLRDVNMDMLNEYVLPADNIVYQRCRYVVEEKERLLQACNDLEAGDMVSFGKRMFATHQGLSKLYEVSCLELDLLVSQVQNNPAVLGARMMGGGFGGCTINLVKESAVAEMIAGTAKAYKTATNKDLSAYVAVIENGTGIL